MSLPEDSKPVVHFHTDCDFFAGCEFMLAHITADPDFNRIFDHQISFRTSDRYLSGLKKRVSSSKIIPLRFVDADAVSQRLISSHGPMSKFLSAAIARVLELPIAVYDGVTLYGILKRTKPALLHINNGGYPGALSCRVAAVAGRLAGVPVRLMVVNNLAVKYQSLTRQTQFLFDRLVASCISTFITGSVAASIELAGVLRVPADRRIVINNGVSVTASPRARSSVSENLALRFGMVANHEVRKGHIILLEAIAQLRDQERIVPGELQFLVEGSGTETNNLLAEISKLNLEDFVIFLGDLEDVHKFMATLDALVLPSVSNEDFPNVISEAMALGLPVIGTDVGGIPEQIEDKKTGLLVRAEDSVALAEAIYFMLKNPRWRVEAGRHALAKFEESYKVDGAVQKYIALYSQLIYGGPQ